MDTNILKYDISNKRITICNNVSNLVTNWDDMLTYIYDKITTNHYDIVKVIVKDTNVQNPLNLSSYGFVKEATIPNVMVYWALYINSHSLNLARQISQLYYSVFPAKYPGNITSAAHIQQLLDDKNVFCATYKLNNAVVGAAFAIPNPCDPSTCEITHVAVHESARGHGVSKKIIQELEKQIKQSKAFRVMFAEARVQSPGMIKTFQSLGFTYAGTLENHVLFSGHEDLAVFYKSV